MFACSIQRCRDTNISENLRVSVCIGKFYIHKAAEFIIVRYFVIIFKISLSLLSIKYF